MTTPTVALKSISDGTTCVSIGRSRLALFSRTLEVAANVLVFVSADSSGRRIREEFVRTEATLLVSMWKGIGVDFLA